MLSNNLDSRVLLFIKLLLQNKERVSVRRIAKWVWYEHSIRMVHLAIHRLLDDKKIVRNNLWEIELPNTKIETRKIPLVRNIDWNGSFVIEDYIRISTKIVSENENYFLFKFKWESMNKCLINNGDLLLVKESITAKNWDVVVILIEGEVILRELQIDINTIKLIAHSTYEEYEPIVVIWNLVIKWVMFANLGQF